MKLAIPDLISNSYFPALAAAELGFFEREGIEVSAELIFPVDRAYEALRDGAVDFVGGAAHGAAGCFDYTMPVLATTDRLIEGSPEIAAAAVRALVATQHALKADVSRAAEVGAKRFPPREAGLIAGIVRRDLPFYDAAISEGSV